VLFVFCAVYYWDFRFLGWVDYQRFGTVYGFPFKGPADQADVLNCLVLVVWTDSHETSVNGCQSTLRNITEERRPHWYRVGTHKITHSLLLVFLRILLAQFRGTDPHADWTGDGVGTSASLDAYENRQLSCLCHELNKNSSAVQTVA
jgi:hypothetical protein